MKKKTLATGFGTESGTKWKIQVAQGNTFTGEDKRICLSGLIPIEYYFSIYHVAIFVLVEARGLQRGRKY